MEGENPPEPTNRRPLEATTKDYLIRTFFEIVGKDDPCYRDYAVRLHNLIFNNVTQITEELIDCVFLPKMTELTDNILLQQTYLSLVTHYDPRFRKCPVFVQYFDKKRGIQQKFLDYTDEDKSVLSILVSRHLLWKVEGFCGDYNTITAKKPEESARLKNLNILLEGKVTSYPLSDGILDRLFNLLSSYMDRDPISFLTQLGEYLMGGYQTDRVLRETQKRYAFYKNQHGYILNTEYARYVSLNFLSICTCLEEQTFIPKNVSEFANDLVADFFLVFIIELYFTLKGCHAKGNGAVCYYFQLGEILKGLVVMHEQLFVPIECRSFEIYPHVQIGAFYKGACEFLEKILQKFNGCFECCRWLLIEKGTIDCAQVAESYQKFIKTPAEGLATEVEKLNEIITTHKVADLEDVALDEVWVHILMLCRDERLEIPRVTTLLEYLFSLPSSYDSALTQIDEDPRKFDYDDKKLIKLNLGITGASLISHNGIEEFITNMESAEYIIQDLKIPMLEE